ncbi:YncE family protein [Terrisporobacter sp.]|uniref:YncE family protein n=1 Tax=Terrisporobacter sp. TaxID=1965305 RepID=UPI00262BB9AE|nr:YncE family protein [Terrisporobacter sp.]
MKVYISNYLSKSISIIDYDTLTLEREIKLDENIYPHHFCIDKEKNKMYLPSSSNGILYVLDMTNEKIIDSSSIGGSLTQVALYGEEVFIANEDSNSIYFMNKNTLDPIGMVSVDDMPHGFCFDLTRKKLYVPCMDSITSIDIINKVIEKKMSIDFKAWHVQLDKYKSEIYVSTLDGKVVVIDEESLQTKQVYDEFLLPVQISFNYKDRKVYIADLGYKNIKILDYNQVKYIGNIAIDGIPQGLEISKDEKRLFVSDTQRNSVKVYDTATNGLIKEIKVGKEPTTIICM